MKKLHRNKSFYYLHEFKYPYRNSCLWNVDAIIYVRADMPRCTQNKRNKKIYNNLGQNSLFF